MAGIGTRLMLLEIDGTEFSGQISAGRVTAAAGESDFTTFEQARTGGSREYRLTFTAVQDAAAGSLWTEVWENAGTEVPFTMIPYGNAVPSVTEPHFEGIATISEPDGDLIGGEADSSTSARFTIDCEWVCKSKPTKVTTP